MIKETKLKLVSNLTKIFSVIFFAVTVAIAIFISNSIKNFNLLTSRNNLSSTVYSLQNNILTQSVLTKAVANYISISNSSDKPLDFDFLTGKGIEEIYYIKEDTPQSFKNIWDSNQTEEFLSIIEQREDKARFLSSLSASVLFDTGQTKLIYSAPVFKFGMEKELANFMGTAILIASDEIFTKTGNQSSTGFFLEITSNSTEEKLMLGNTQLTSENDVKVSFEALNSIVTLSLIGDNNLGIDQNQLDLPNTIVLLGVILGVLAFVVSGYILIQKETLKENRSETKSDIITDNDTLESLINFSPIVIFTIDLDGKILLSIGGGLYLIGSAPGKNVGKNIWEIYKDVPAIIRNLNRAFAGERFSETVKTGDIYFETLYAPLIEEEKITGVIGVAINVTEKEKSLKTIAERNLELENLNKHMVEREMKMIELKKEIRDLKNRK